MITIKRTNGGSTRRSEMRTDRPSGGGSLEVEVVQFNGVRADGSRGWKTPRVMVRYDGMAPSTASRFVVLLTAAVGECVEMADHSPDSPWHPTPEGQPVVLDL